MTPAVRTTFAKTVAILLLMILAGCDSEPSAPDVSDPTFTQIQQTIFDTSCAVLGCHACANAPWGLNLEASSSYANLVNVPARSKPDVERVSPGRPDSSYIINVLENSPGITVSRMPFGQDALPSDQIEMIRFWIDAGAKNN